MNAVKLSEIREDLNKYDANSLLGDGWVYLNSKVTRSINSKGAFEDEITYALGKPAKESTSE